MKQCEGDYLMPIIAQIPINKLIFTIISILDYIRNCRKIRISTIKINGYFLYRYRGILLVRKGFSDVIIIHDFNAVKKYLSHVMNSVLKSEYVAWARTSGLIEIIIEAERKNKTGIIIIEASNDVSNERGNFSLKVITHETSKPQQEKTNTKRNVSTLETVTPDIIDVIDELIIEEDLKKLVPIDIYEFFDAKDVDVILRIISNNNGFASITETTEDV